MKNQAIQPVTPPLLAQSPIPIPYIPSSPANLLPLASESSDSVAAEAQALHNQILIADIPMRQGSDSSDSMLLDVTHTPQCSPLFESLSLPALKRRAEDLKVEGPLTPPMFSTSPAKKLKSVSFAETLHEYILTQPWREENVDGDRGHNVDKSSSADFEEFFQGLEPLTKETKKKIENEQLSGADTTARVDVPDIDFSLPIAPWNEYSQRNGGKYLPADTELHSQTKFLSRIKREDLKAMNSWHGLSKPERELPWSFLITKVSTLNLEEKLHGESEMNKVITEMTKGGITTSAAQVWKREGLRILDEEEEEEDLEPAENEERWDIESLLRKRKLEIEGEAVEKRHRQKVSGHTVRRDARSPTEAQESHHWNETIQIQHPLPRSQTKSMGNSRERPPALTARQKSLQPPNDTGSGLMFGGFSATTALHKFMETRGKPVESACRPDPSKNCLQPKTPTLAVRSTQPSYQTAFQTQQAKTQPREVDELQKQTCKEMRSVIPSNLAPCSFVISSTFLQHRRLLKEIERLYPAAEMVYRDYTLPHSPAKEAEIILSPSTGLVFTTLQKVKQRALPGQPDRSQVRELVLDLQVRYERLVVVVSEGLSREMEELGSSRPDDARDRDALKDLEAFATQVEGNVLVRYVHGGEKALANLIVVEMAKYGLPYGSVDIGDIKPVAQETSVSTLAILKIKRHLT